MAEEEEQHDHMCMECGEDVPCNDPDECEDPYEETLCKECLKEQEELVEEENNAI